MLKRIANRSLRGPKNSRRLFCASELGPGGVSIGDRAVIGAGSVVTRDIPPDVVAVGNPGGFVRSLPPDAG